MKPMLHVVPRPVILHFLFAACVLGAVLVPAISRAAVFVLRVPITSTNVTTSALTIDDPHINGHPGYKLIVIHDFGTGAGGAANDSPLGVRFNNDPQSATFNKWQIVNEDGTSITVPTGATGKFNVLINTTATIRVNAGPANSDFDWSFFGLKKGNPNARFLVTHAINPFLTKTPGQNINKNVGMFYVSAGAVTNGVWSVFYEDQKTPFATSFNVLDITTSNDAHHSGVLVSAAANTSSDQVAIDDPMSNNNPNAVVFASHIYDVPGEASNLFNKTIGVFYNGSKWTIYTEDLSAVPAGITFFFQIYPHTIP
jgi:hypothetical protein